MDLFFNYLKISWRDLVKHKVFSSINVVGLVVGITASLVIIQWVLFETSYDKFHEDYQNIYRVSNDRFQNGELIQHGTITYPTIGPQLYKDYPEVTHDSVVEPAIKRGLQFIYE